MSDNVTNDLILEHLKYLRDDANAARSERHEIRDEIRALTGHLSALKQCDLKRDSQQPSLFQRIERIERRLELSEGGAWS